MNVESSDPLHRMAEQVADCFAGSGYAFVEEDKIDGLARLLGSFLATTGIPTNPPRTDDLILSDDEPIPSVSQPLHQVGMNDHERRQP